MTPAISICIKRFYNLTLNGTTLLFFLRITKGGWMIALRKREPLFVVSTMARKGESIDHMGWLHFETLHPGQNNRQFCLSVCLCAWKASHREHIKAVRDPPSETFQRPRNTKVNRIHTSIDYFSTDWRLARFMLTSKQPGEWLASA